ncbi:MAG TPA: alpha/beta hydrolase [Mycobacteriales bacterium]|nr:alpha/beta hydrolase [Mycobacteriales bacterium]
MATRRLVLLGLAGLLAGCSRPRPAPDAGDAGAVSSHRYGPAAIQVADLHRPAGSAIGLPVVVMLHGGYWSSVYDRSLQEDVVADLVGAGWAVWNVDYRSVGNGGGYPRTFTDVAAACDLLADLAPELGLDATRVAVVGHSAGGTLALWAAGRHRLAAGTPGAGPRLRPAAVVSQAGVNDLAAAAGEHLGDDAVAALLGVPPDDDPDGVYAVTSPVELLPLGVPTLVVTGDSDATVPPGHTSLYAQAATAVGDPVQLQMVAGEGHFEHLDPSSRVWGVVREFLQAQVPPA